MKHREHRRDIPPTKASKAAIELLARQVGRADEIRALRYDDPRVDAWIGTTEEILIAAFGSPGGELHRKVYEFKYAHRGQIRVDMSSHEIQANHVATTDLRRELLLSYIEQLGDLEPVQMLADGVPALHPVIDGCSGQLYRDGHYQQAVLTAYIEVIDAVKRASGLGLDGDQLMNRAFGCENQVPVIKFNELQSPADRDEQKGMMYLYKGVVALRNSKAHRNRLIDDSARAHDYLALSSLLLRLLEIADVER